MRFCQLRVGYELPTMLLCFGGFWRFGSVVTFLQQDSNRIAGAGWDREAVGAEA